MTLVLQGVIIDKAFQKAIESLKTIYDEERVELQTSNSYKKNEQKRLKTKQEINFFGEFDPGSGLTLAACLIHASRMVAIPWRTGE